MARYRCAESYDKYNVTPNQINLGKSHLECIIQLGEPRTSCPGHDVPFLTIEGGDILANLLHDLQCIHLQIFGAHQKSKCRDEEKNTFPELLSLASWTSAKLPRPITRITFQGVCLVFVERSPDFIGQSFISNPIFRFLNCGHLKVPNVDPQLGKSVNNILQRKNEP